MNNKRKISKISQLVCQNQLIPFKKSTAFKLSLKILQNNLTIPIIKPITIPYSPAFGVIFLEKIPNKNTDYGIIHENSEAYKEKIFAETGWYLIFKSDGTSYCSNLLN